MGPVKLAHHVQDFESSIKEKIIKEISKITPDYTMLIFPIDYL